MRRLGTLGRGAAACLAAAAVAAGGCGGAPSVRAWGAANATPGLRLSLTAIEQSRAEGRTDVAYRVHADGVPRGLALRLWERRWNAAPAPVPGVFVNDEGRLVSAQTRVEARLHATGLARGEPYEVGIVAPDESVRAFARVVPVPVTAVADGCRISAELASAAGDAWTVLGAGFGPREELNAVLKSGDDEHLETILTGPDGTFTRTTFPAVHFKRIEGEGTYTVVSGTRRLSLPIVWGPRALKAG